MDKEWREVMNKTEFKELIERVKSKNPRIFGLDSDMKPSIKDIELTEQYYSIVFLESYKEFLLLYGGGYFGFTAVYSLDPNSPFFMKNNVSVEFLNTNKLFPVIDFETGDLACFKVDNGICKDWMMLYNHEEKTISEMKMNFYDTLAKYALKWE